MSYIDSRNKFILSVNKPELKKMPDFFTPDDIANFVGRAVKEYIGKEKVSLLDPMGGSGNLFYHVIKTIGKDSFSGLKINRFKQKGDDKELYQTITDEISKLEGSDKYSIAISGHTVVKSKDKADIIIANLDGKFLGNHGVIQYVTNKYCFILDTNSPKNNINWDEKNFSVEKVIFLGDKIGIEGKQYYLYIYKKEKSGEKDFGNVYYKYSGDYKEFKNSENIFIGKRQELVLSKKLFNDLIEKNTLDNIEVDLLPINEVLNEIQKSNRVISNNFSKLLSGININWIPESDIGVIEIIQNIQETQKIKSDKLYEILISLSVSNFLIFSGPSGVGKTSLVGKISEQIGGKYLKSPIKSNFSDETGLLGYWNPLLSKYEGTDVLSFIFESSLGGNRKRPFFLLLDEMNLSRIENYFSEFLIKIDDFKNGSIEIKLFETLVDNDAKFNNIKYFIKKYNLTEKEVKLNGIDFKNILIKEFKKNSIESFSVEIKINIYSNLHIIGTINEDETTFSLSNKVLDRAFYIELGVDNLFQEESEKFTLKSGYNNFIDKNILEKFSANNIKVLFGDYKKLENLEKKLNTISKDKSNKEIIMEIFKLFEKPLHYNFIAYIILKYIGKKSTGKTFDQTISRDIQELSRKGDLFKLDDGIYFNKNIRVNKKDFLYMIEEKKYFNITEKNKGNIEEIDGYKDFFNNLNKIIQKINPMDAIGYRTINEIAKYFENYTYFIDNNLRDLGGKNVQDLSGNKIDVIGSSKKNILDIILCQKVLPKMKNYFLLRDKEKYFEKLCNLIEKNIGKDTRSYKKVSEIREFLFNN